MNQTLVFSPGVVSESIQVLIIDDEEYEGLHFLHATLTTDDSGVHIFSPSATINITDNGKLSLNCTWNTSRKL